MKTILRALALLATVAAATPASAICMRMEGPPPGTTAGVGPLATFVDGQARLGRFHYFPIFAGSTVSGVSTVVASNHASGSPTQEMNLNNITLGIRPTSPVTTASFAYADFGGNVNLHVNGVLHSRMDLSAVPASVGGVLVSVTRMPTILGYHYGTVTLTADAEDIERFGVGGQEFFVDDVCW